MQDESRSVAVVAAVGWRSRPDVRGRQWRRRGGLEKDSRDSRWFRETMPCPTEGHKTSSRCDAVIRL